MHGSSTIESAERPTCAVGLGAVLPFAVPTSDFSRRPPRTHPIRASPKEVHPYGLYLLCAVEACAGFALYMLGSLLVLYLTESAHQDQATALRWVGTFNASCSIAPLVGGMLADRWLGFRRAVLGGVVLLAAGFVVLALVSAVPWPGLALLLLGSGLFRSNIVAMLGRLYVAGDSKRDSGYRLMYAAYNLGALLAPPLAGVMARARRWPIAFFLAAGAMLLAFLMLKLGHRQLARSKPPDYGKYDHVAELDRLVGNVPRWLAIGVVAQVALLWAIAYGQTDGTLLLWARDHTRRLMLGVEVPASIFASVPPLLVLLLTPLWALADRSISVSATIAKILAGLVCTSLGFALMLAATRSGGVPTSALWLLGCLALLTTGEVLVGPLTQSLISRLAPRRIFGLTCALWHGATAIGFWLAGQLGTLWRSRPHQDFFALLALVPVLAGVLLLVQRSYLRIALAGRSGGASCALE